MNRITAIHEAIGASRNESEAISMKVNITVGDRTITATMEDNAAGRDFLSRLPLEVTFGAVGAWLINYSLGIRRDETSPGFKLSLHID